MSAQGSFWAWKHRGLSSAMRLVLLCLGQNHNDGRGQCNPGTKYICDSTDLNKKTVPAALSKLAEMGLISFTQRAGFSRDYELHFDRIYWRGELIDNTEWDARYKIERDTRHQKRVASKAGVPKNGYTQKSMGVPPKTGSGVYPKTGTKPITEPSKEPNNNYSDSNTIFNQLKNSEQDRWSPPEEIVEQLVMHKNIPSEFIFDPDRLFEFVIFWKETSVPRTSWGAKFYKHTIKQWVHKQTNDQRADKGVQHGSSSSGREEVRDAIDDIANIDWLDPGAMENKHS